MRYFLTIFFALVVTAQAQVQPLTLGWLPDKYPEYITHCVIHKGGRVYDVKTFTDLGASSGNHLDYRYGQFTSINIAFTSRSVNYFGVMMFYQATSLPTYDSGAGGMYQTGYSFLNYNGQEMWKNPHTRSYVANEWVMSATRASSGTKYIIWDSPTAVSTNTGYVNWFASSTATVRGNNSKHSIAVFWNDALLDDTKRTEIIRWLKSLITY